MQIGFILVKGRSNQANQQDTLQPPDAVATQCNISLAKLKNVNSKINDSLV